MSRRLFLQEKLVDIGQPLGSGAYGRVLLASARTGEAQRFAVKVNLVDQRTNFIGCMREIDMLARTAHLDSTVEILGVLTDTVAIHDEKYRADNVLLLLECGHCNLTEWIERRPNGRARISASAQLLAAVAQLHTLRIIHRDIKPCNVLCFEGGTGGTEGGEGVPSQGPSVRLKLCDFGMAKVWALHDQQSAQIMTPEYRPPEIAAELAYGLRADCWSVGAVLYEVLLGHYLFHTEGTRTNAWIVAEQRKLPKTRKLWEKHVAAEGVSVAEELCVVNSDWQRHIAALLSDLLMRTASKRVSCAQCLLNPLFGCELELQSRAQQLDEQESLSDDYDIPVSDRRAAFVSFLLATHEVLENESWYGCRALFCALSIFDRLETLLQSPPAHPREWAVAIVYLSLKYHSDSQGLAYNELFSNDVCGPAFMERVGKYELLILCDFLNFHIHVDTLFDHAALIGNPSPHARILLQEMASLPPGRHSLAALAQKNMPLLKSRKSK